MGCCDRGCYRMCSRIAGGILGGNVWRTTIDRKVRSLCFSITSRSGLSRSLVCKIRRDHCLCEQVVARHSNLHCVSSGCCPYEPHEVCALHVCRITAMVSWTCLRWTEAGRKVEQGRHAQDVVSPLRFCNWDPGGARDQLVGLASHQAFTWG